ncbi:SBBP repeat-containing protein [Archangium minus]
MRTDPSGDSKALLMRVGSLPQESTPQFWTREFDNPGASDTLDVLALHPDTGELYFAGRTTGAFPTFQHYGQQDIFIGGPRGNEREQILYQGGTVRPQLPNRLAFTAQRADNGNKRDIIVSGYDDVYVPANYVERWEDPFVLKVAPGEDGLLRQQWWTEFNTPYTDTLGGLAVDTTGAGALYVTGYNPGGAQKGAFVRKLDSTTGALGDLWRQTTYGADMMHAAHVRDDGKLLIVGATFMKLGDTAYGEQDVVVRLLDPSTLVDGNPKVEWTSQYGSPGSEWVTDMAVDSHGNIFVVGETGGAISSEFVNKGIADIFLLKFSPEGKLLAQKQWGSPGDDHPSAVAVDACGEAFIVGYTTGNLLGDAFPVRGVRDAFVLTTAKAKASEATTP